MKALLISATVAMALLLLGTALIATQTPRAHEALMAQLATSGLAREQASAFQPGWLSSHSSGSLRLASALCEGCDQLEYEGTVRQGLGAWLAGQFTPLHLDYQLRLPSLPVEPALPPLALTARAGLSGLRASLSLPPSSHAHETQAHAWQFSQDGIAGALTPGRLQLALGQLRLQRDKAAILDLQQLELQAAADEQVHLRLASQALDVPPWSWQAEQPSARYRQRRDGQRLDLALELAIPGGQVAGQEHHPPLSGELEIRQLDLPATRAFAERLPALLSPQTPAAARMFGLLSLYSVHGPAFFAAAPQLDLQAQDLPLTGGPGTLALRLAVTPGLRRPPMHPQEWRQALDGVVDVSAPPHHLAAWWAFSADLVNTITGLPRSYAVLREQGWVQALPDGRDRLYFRLEPPHGPRKAAS